jgi:acyl-coenzyme A thioesterase PaaI-like protein
MSDLKVRAQLTDLLARDRFAKGLGISLVEAENGSSTVTMEVKVEHLNFMGWAIGVLSFLWQIRHLV